MSKNILLLTATIEPKSGQNQLSITDVEERKNEYMLALKFYEQVLAQGIIDHIIFVENSNFDLADFKSTFAHKGIEWVSFYGLDYNTSYHRGYGEFKLLDYAHNTSTILTTAAANDKVWKVSGRYILKNIKTLIRKAPKDYSLYCDTTDNWSEMSVMAWSVEGFSTYLKPVWPEFATGMAPELILAEKINTWKKDRADIKTKYTWPPYLIGRRGTSGKSFQGNFGLLRHFRRIIIGH